MKSEERINKIIDEKEQYQLQALRLEAENKRLKDIIKALKDTVIQWKKEYDIIDSIVDLKDAVIAELKAENERLKEEIKQLEDFIKSDGEIDHINHKYTYKLQQTLQEIKEIAENREIFCENCSFCCDDFTCDDCGYVKILQLINKAESEG